MYKFLNNSRLFRTLIISRNSQISNVKCNYLKNFKILTRHASFIENKELDSNSKKFTVAQKIVYQAPISIQPYLKIIRIDKPTGNWLIIWPSTWGIALAAAPGSFPDPYLLSLFVVGAFLMRGAGCIINDMLDKDIDSKVERTLDRPLVNGTMTMQQAFAFLGAELTLALLILLQLNTYSILLGASCMGLVVTYPLFKRITYWPQAVLGLTLNWGILVGYSAIHGSLDPICFPMYLAATCWTLIYDTIYARQDIQDDIKHGVKSTAIRFGENTKIWLTGFSAISAAGLLGAGILGEQTWPYYTAVAFTASHILWQIHGGNINDAKDCAQKHKSNSLVGLILFLGITIGNLLRKKEKVETKNLL